MNINTIYSARFATFNDVGTMVLNDGSEKYIKSMNNSIESIILVFRAYGNYKDWLKCNGIVKGNIVEFSEKPISSIPFRVIDWANEKEVELHNSISEQTKNYLKNQDKSLLDLINQSFNKLFSITE